MFRKSHALEHHSIPFFYCSFTALRLFCITYIYTYIVTYICIIVVPLCSMINEMLCVLSPTLYGVVHCCLQVHSGLVAGLGCDQRHFLPECEYSK